MAIGNINIQSGNLLNHALLQTICQLRAVDDYSRLRTFGISDENLTELDQLNATELAHSAHLDMNFVSVKIDNSALTKLIKRVREESESREKIRQLILLGAPLNLLKEIVGLNSVDFAGLRKKLGIENTGRSHIPSETELESIYQEWRKWDFETDLTIDAWIEMGKNTGITLCTVYPVIKGPKKAGSSSVSKPRQRSNTSSSRTHVA